MAVPYSHSLNSNAQKAYDRAISNRGSVLNHCPQRSGVVFGLEVQQTAPNNYLNTSNPCSKSFHNPFNDYRFPKVLVRVLYHQEPTQSGPLGLSIKTKAQQNDDNILYTSQSEFRIDHVWSMAVEANSPSHSINANHSPLDATLKDTAGNGSSGMERSTSPISSVVDNTSQKANEQSRKRKASRKTYEKSEKRKASRKAYRESGKYKAYQKAYRQSNKFKAYQKAYRESDKGKAYHKAYGQSEKGKACRKAYLQSDKGKATCMAYQKAYRQSDKCKAYQKNYQKDYQKAYKKAYNEAFKNTGDREQAKIAGKQAAAFIRNSHKVKNSELDAIPSPPQHCPKAQ